MTFDPKEHGSSYGDLYDILNNGLTAKKARKSDILTVCPNEKCRNQVTIRLKIDSVGEACEYNHIGFSTEDSGAYVTCGHNADKTAYVQIDDGDVFCPDGEKKGCIGPLRQPGAVLFAAIDSQSKKVLLKNESTGKNGCKTNFLDKKYNQRF